MADAVVIGAGPNGLVAANILADADWDVVVLEQQPAAGGAVRSAEDLAAGFVRDLCSAFYPLAAASPAIAALDLEAYGLRWSHAPSVLAHPLPDGRCAVLSRDPDETAASLERLGAGDGAAWHRLYARWRRIGPHLLDSLFVPFPPVRPGARLTRELGPSGLLRLARFLLLPVRRLVEEEFTGPGGALLLTGSALHADLAPEAAGSAVYGWVLGMLAQQYGFPVPVGGAGELTAALVRRLESRGGRVLCGAEVREVVVRRGRAVAVRTASGNEVTARRAVLADVVAPRLYGGLVSWQHLPSRLRDDLRRFQWDHATFKVDWALRSPVPWSAEAVRHAGTVHVSASVDQMTEYSAALATGRVPTNPFLLVGQMTTSDPSRSPAGTESLWAYTHVPREVRGEAAGDVSGRWDEGDCQAFAARIEAEMERFAPGFRSLVVARHVTPPQGLADHDANLVGGAINGGTSSLHQQLVFRPTPGLGRPETPIAGLYLASSSAHPGGGVHGACGANAARAALRAYRLGTRRLSAAVVRRATGP